MECVAVDSLWKMARLLNVTQPLHGVLAALNGEIVGFQLITVIVMVALTIEILVSEHELIFQATNISSWEQALELVMSQGRVTGDNMLTDYYSPLREQGKLNTHTPYKGNILYSIFKFVLRKLQEITIS